MSIKICPHLSDVRALIAVSGSPFELDHAPEPDEKIAIRFSNPSRSRWTRGAIIIYGVRGGSQWRRLGRGYETETPYLTPTDLLDLETIPTT